MRERAVTLGMGIAAALQVGLLAAALGARAARDLSWRSGSDPASPPELAAVAELPALAAAIPPDARVLLVSDVLPRVAWEYWFVPRPFRLLLRFPPDFEALVPPTRVEGWYLRWRHRRFAARDAVFTDASWRRAVDAADWVVAFGFAGDLGARDPRLAERARSRHGVLYELRR